MSELCYSIVMLTPLGKKHGILSASRSGNLLRGWLDLLEHREAFTGTIDSAGNCSITGKLITLMRTVPYVANGKLTPSDVHLQLHTDHSMFELSGTACRQKGETEACVKSTHGS